MIKKMGIMIQWLKPTLMMVAVQASFAGINIFYKLASIDGMNLKIMVAYRFLFAATSIVPVALYVERKKRPKLTRRVVFQSFLCGLFSGSMTQNLYSKSLVLTSTTFASATTNLIPAITFLMAVAFRLEKLEWKTSAGKMKVLGTLVGLGGAMLLTFYKGPQINIGIKSIDLLQNNQSSKAQNSADVRNNVLGALLAFGSCVCYALWLIVQAKMAEEYPCPYSMTALTSVMGAIQGVVFALCFERDLRPWKLGWNIRLLTVAYTGIVASSLMFTLVAWCVQRKGPLFVSAFNPLMLVIVAILGSLILDERLHLGSVVGAVLIVSGLYVVLWGKGKEMKKMQKLVPEKSSEELEEIQVVINSTAEKHSYSDGTNTNREMNILIPNNCSDDHNKNHLGK